MNRRIATGVGGFMALILVSIGAAATDGPVVPPAVSTQQVVLLDHPVEGPICLDSAGFGGVYCIWPEQRRPARNGAPPPPPPSQNQPPPPPAAG